jgi:hypothetical protein
MSEIHHMCVDSGSQLSLQIQLFKLQSDLQHEREIAATQIGMEQIHQQNERSEDWSWASPFSTSCSQTKEGEKSAVILNLTIYAKLLPMLYNSEDDCLNEPKQYFAFLNNF